MRTHKKIKITYIVFLLFIALRQPLQASFFNKAINMFFQNDPSPSPDTWNRWVNAAKQGNKRALVELVETSDSYDKNQCGSTALLLSLQKGYLDCVKYLVEQDIDVNVIGNDGNSALMFGAYSGNVDCLRYLVQQGADVYAKNKDAETALHWSAQLGYPSCVKFLVEQGADIYGRNGRKNTALMESAENGHLDCLKFLSQQGAIINDDNEMRNTPLLLSAQESHLDCVQYLLRHGADTDAKNKDGCTALHLSAQKGYLDCVTLLLQYGAKVNVQNNNGDTALRLSAQRKHVACVKVLLANGADISARDKIGNTALVFVALTSPLRFCYGEKKAPERWVLSAYGRGGPMSQHFTDIPNSQHFMQWTKEVKRIVFQYKLEKYLGDWLADIKAIEEELINLTEKDQKALHYSFKELIQRYRSPDSSGTSMVAPTQSNEKSDSGNKKAPVGQKYSKKRPKIVSRANTSFLLTRDDTQHIVGVAKVAQSENMPKIKEIEPEDCISMDPAMAVIDRLYLLGRIDWERFYMLRSERIFNLCLKVSNKELGKQHRMSTLLEIGLFKEFMVNISKGTARLLGTNDYTPKNNANNAKKNV